MLSSRDNERGAAPVEMTFAIILLMMLSLGVVQVAFTLYSRNIVAASAHEGARAALERGRTNAEAESIVRDVIARATGRLVKDLSVDIATTKSTTGRSIIVRVRGLMSDFGPVPIPIPLSSTATAHLDEVAGK
ncbi:MAG: pilus assembly protein [Acidobacteria bacterium]|nr:pilus assembly protein [Acidobacteriota bacterium]